MLAAGESLIVSCEHGGNRIPGEFRPYFAGARQTLHSHRGYDAGALRFARALAAALSAPLFASTTSRLLIDLNRSPGHPALYSEMTRLASREVRESIYARHYLPYRQNVERAIAEELARGRRVTHVSCHSFTPVFGGAERDADVGFLYDPRRPAEVDLCRRAIAALRARSPQWRSRRNYPYRGRADGLCTWLRRAHADAPYAGIEVELNQRHHAAENRAWIALCDDVVAALAVALGGPRAAADETDDGPITPGRVASSSLP